MASEKRIEKIKHVVSQRQSGLVVVLEDIHDPHNAEAIFRSCDAFGVQDVYLIFDKEKPFNPKKVGKQSSSSANKWLNFHTFRSTKDCFDELKRKKYELVGTVLGKGSSLFESSFKEKLVALVVGNEHAGLSVEAQKLCDRLVTIPMRGMVESFNVSVASALFLSEISRQRTSLAHYTLSKKEQEVLVEDFVTRSSKRQKRD